MKQYELFINGEFLPNRNRGMTDGLDGFPVTHVCCPDHDPRQ